MRLLVLTMTLWSLGGCARNPWMGVLDGMKTQTVRTELSTEEHDFNAERPEGFAPAEDNRWILFFYDPAAQPDVHASFQRLGDDCYATTVKVDDPEDDAFEPRQIDRHVAVCAFDRVPPIPEGIEVEY